MSNTLAAIGCLLVAVALLFVNAQKTFPGWWALLPTLGTAFLIAAGDRSWINRTLLAFPLRVFFGLISYPLYLWHWPLLVYLDLISTSDLIFAPMVLRMFRVGAIVFSVFLAWTTWRFWETPLRRSHLVSQMRKVQGLIAAMSLVLLWGVLSISNIFAPRLNTPYVVRVTQAITDWSFPSSADNFKRSVFTASVIPSNSNRTVLFAGDSQMAQYWPRVNATISANPNLLKAIFATHGNCPPLPGLNSDWAGLHCPQFYNFWREQANAASVSTVVIGAYWEHYLIGEYSTTTVLKPVALRNAFGEPAATADISKAWDGFDRTVASLVHAGKRVFILSSPPASPSFNPLLLLHRLGQIAVAGLHPINESNFNRFIGPIEAKLFHTASIAGATVVRPVDFFCGNDVCPAVDDQGSPLHKDDDPLRSGTVIERANFIDRMLQPF